MAGGRLRITIYSWQLIAEVLVFQYPVRRPDDKGLCAGGTLHRSGKFCRLPWFSSVWIWIQAQSAALLLYCELG